MPDIQAENDDDLTPAQRKQELDRKIANLTAGCVRYYREATDPISFSAGVRSLIKEAVEIGALYERRTWEARKDDETTAEPNDTTTPPPPPTKQQAKAATARL